MKRSFDEIKNIYLKQKPDVDTESVEKGNKIQVEWHIEKLEAAIKTIEKTDLHKGTKILDIACGSGPLTMKIAKRFPELNFVGCDFNENAINVAKKNSKKSGLKNISFFSDPAEKMSVENNSFDMVMALDALDHFYEPKKALKEMKRVSKNNAMLLLAVGNYHSFWPLLEIFIDKMGLGRDYVESHLTHFNKKSLNKMVEETGFREKKITTMHNLRPFLNVITKKYPKNLENFFSNHCFGMTLLLTAKK